MAESAGRGERTCQAYVSDTIPAFGRSSIHAAWQHGRSESLAKTPLPSNEWTHVAVTLQGDAGKLYVNGQVVASGDHMKLNPNELLATEAYLGKPVCGRPLF